MDEIRDWLIRLRLGDPDKRPELRRVRDPAIEETLAALLSWRDKHTAKMVREARLDEQNQTDLHLGWQEIMFVPNGDWDKAITQKERIAQLTTNSKEKG